MPVQTLILQPGDTISLPSGEARATLWRVAQRTKDGYRMASQQGEPDRFWTHREIFDHYVSGETEIWHCNLAGLDQGLAEMVQSDFESWPARKVFEAKCRHEYVKRVEVLRARGVPTKIAYQRAARVVTKAHKAEWARQAERIDAVEKAEINKRRRKAVPTFIEPDLVMKGYELGEYAVRNWYRRWKMTGEDVRALISQDHRRGDHSPRKTCKLSEQTDGTKPLCVYGAMAWVGRSVWMQTPRVTKAYAYERLKEMCEKGGFELVSKTAFYNFLAKFFSEFEEYRARYGPRLAYYKYHIFERRALPERALAEVEVDHCLLDVFVEDHHGRKARPWLTLLICRATKMILGIHISFDVPSYVTLSRAIIHAISPKDLSGLPEIKNQWPCHGVWDILLTDRGLEFLSESLQRAARDLKFAIINLPRREPQLKGSVERFFGSLGIRVISYLEGTTLSRAEQFYDPKKRARFTLAELTAKIVKWIVDDYHYSPHETLGVPPIQRWKELVEDDVQYGGVRPVPNFSQLTMLMGERISRKISNVGIGHACHTYASPQLEELRQRRGGLTNDIEILADPTNRGHIWVLDKKERKWLVVPAVNQKTSQGLNKFASRVVMRVARQIAPKGGEITDAILLEARQRCEREAQLNQSRSALRFSSDGALATDLVGNNGILSVLTAPSLKLPSPANNDDQAWLFPEMEELPPRLRDLPENPLEGEACEPAPKPAKARRTAKAGKAATNDNSATSGQARTATAAQAAEQKASLRSLISSRTNEMRTIR